MGTIHLRYRYLCGGALLAIGFGLVAGQPVTAAPLGLGASAIPAAAEDSSLVTEVAVRGGGRVGVGRVGIGRVGIGRVGVGRVGIGYGRAGIGYGRAALAYRGGWNRYYRPGLGLAAGAALGTAAAYYGGGYDGGYYGNSGYGAYASAAYDTSGGDTYILHGNYMSESDAVAYCARLFRSYDVESRTFLAYSGQRVSCPQ